MPRIDERQAERFDERRLPGAGRAADADARRFAAGTHQLVEQRGSFVSMVGPR